VVHKKVPKVLSEGSYKAAVEELVEATMFRRFLARKHLTKLTGIPVADDVYIAGLADVPGELYRYSLKMGTEGASAEVMRAAAVATEIVEALIDFDLTKHLRVKFDQAKSSLHKIERVVYELSKQ
jgi:predicted translin family RNA/ssDNA-binding protein